MSEQEMYNTIQSELLCESKHPHEDTQILQDSCTIRPESDKTQKHKTIQQDSLQEESNDVQESYLKVGLVKANQESDKMSDNQQEMMNMFASVWVKVEVNEQEEESSTVFEPTQPRQVHYTFPNSSSHTKGLTIFQPYYV